MCGVLTIQKGVRKQPIIALYFEFEIELKFYNLRVCLMQMLITILTVGYVQLKQTCLMAGCNC